MNGKELTEEKELIVEGEHLLEAFTYPVFRIDAEGHIVQINTRALHLCSKTKKELENVYIFEMFGDSQRAFELYREIVDRGFGTDTQLRLKTGDGIIEVCCNGALVHDKKDQCSGALFVVRDITAQKRFENELIEARRIAEHARQMAEEAAKTKQQFLSNMSHEIRTPLNAIIGFTKVVLKTELSEKQKEYLNAIKISGDALIVLINDILDLAKVESGKMTFEKTPFKLTASVSAMLHLFETKIQNKNIELEKGYDTQIPEILVGDPIRLHQVILNLVSNAVKFTREGKIAVNIRLLDEDREKAILEFSVTDTGIGIPEDQLEHIFDDFHQVGEHTSRVYGGTGLGLSIARQLIERQGGSLWVKSKVGAGSTFTFILSFRKQRPDIKENVETGFEKQETEVEHTSAEKKNARILVVEDVTLNQLLMKTLLEEFGFEMDLAANGKVAIEKMREKKYDVVLMDLQMPEMNGFETTRYIRNKMHSHVPIIALTADVTTVDVEKCRAAGMDDYIAKPIQDKLLYNKIMRFISDQYPPVSPGGEVRQSNRVINLEYMRHHTAGNKKIMVQMIGTYLEETPYLLGMIRKSIDNMDWDSLHEAANSLIPSFLIVGMSKECEDMAKLLQEYARKRSGSLIIGDLVRKIETACGQAYAELRQELEQL